MDKEQKLLGVEQALALVQVHPGGGTRAELKAMRLEKRKRERKATLINEIGSQKNGLPIFAAHFHCSTGICTPGYCSKKKPPKISPMRRLAWTLLLLWHTVHSSASLDLAERSLLPFQPLRCSACAVLMPSLSHDRRVGDVERTR